ncbi:hypothetical protein KW787_03730 [Candidatus Pacearchaeota archaeon]|nr:hypothetical protein [Candidatus Pacearchaeota archaeon]
MANLESLTVSLPKKVLQTAFSAYLGAGVSGFAGIMITGGLSCLQNAVEKQSQLSLLLGLGVCVLSTLPAGEGADAFYRVRRNISEMRRGNYIIRPLY